MAWPVLNFKVIYPNISKYTLSQTSLFRVNLGKSWKTAASEPCLGQEIFLGHVPDISIYVSSWSSSYLAFSVSVRQMFSLLARKWLSTA